MCANKASGHDNDGGCAKRILLEGRVASWPASYGTGHRLTSPHYVHVPVGLRRLYFETAQYIVSQSILGAFAEPWKRLALSQREQMRRQLVCRLVCEQKELLPRRASRHIVLDWQKSQSTTTAISA